MSDFAARTDRHGLTGLRTASRHAYRKKESTCEEIQFTVSSVY